MYIKRYITFMYQRSQYYKGVNSIKKLSIDQCSLDQNPLQCFGEVKIINVMNSGYFPKVETNDDIRQHLGLWVLPNVFKLPPFPITAYDTHLYIIYFYTHINFKIKDQEGIKYKVQNTLEEINSNI